MMGLMLKRTLSIQDRTGRQVLRWSPIFISISPSLPITEGRHGINGANRHRAQQVNAETQGVRKPERPKALKARRCPCAPMLKIGSCLRKLRRRANTIPRPPGYATLSEREAVYQVSRRPTALPNAQGIRRLQAKLLDLATVAVSWSLDAYTWNRATLNLLQLAVREVFDRLFLELQLPEFHSTSFCFGALLLGFGNHP